MKVYRENISQPLGSSFACREYKACKFVCPYHFHPEVEITYIISSEGRRFVGDNIGRFAPGDLILFGSGLPHMYFNDERQKGDPLARSQCIQFKPEILGESLIRLPEMVKIKQLIETSRQGLRFYGDSVEWAHQKMTALIRSKGAVRIAHLIELLQILADCEQRETLASENFSKTQTFEEDPRATRAYAIINERFRERLTQEQLAKALNMSPSACSRFFQRSSGKTFSHFLAEVRIGYACQKLQNSQDSILDICYESGYSNLSNFNRRFLKTIGMTPKDYRKASRESRLEEGQIPGRFKSEFF